MAISLDREKNELALRTAAKAGEDDKVKSLITAKVDVNAAGYPSKKTALHWAAKYGHQTVVKTLLAAGARPIVYDADDRTPLGYAEDANYKNIVADLKEKMAFTTEEEQGFTVLQKAFSVENVQPSINLEDVEIIKKRVAKLLTALKLARNAAKENEVMAKPLQKYLILAVAKHLFKERSYLSLSESEKTQVSNFLNPFYLVPSLPEVLFAKVEIGLTGLQEKCNNVGFALLFAQGVIADIIICERMLENTQKEFLTQWKLVKANIAKSDGQKIKKLMLDDNHTIMDNFMRGVIPECHAILGKPSGFLDLLRKYFPGEELDCMTAFSALRFLRIWQEKDDKKEFKKTQMIIVTALHHYYQDCLEEYNTILLNKMLTLRIGLQKSNPSESNCHQVVEASLKSAENLFNSLVNILCYNIETQQVTGSVKNYPMLTIMHYFLIGRKFIEFENIRLTKMDAFLEQSTKLTCDGLRREFLRTHQLQEPSESYELARAKERKVQKEIEAKKREENMAVKQEAQLHAFKLEQKKATETKERDEKQERVSAILGNLNVRTHKFYIALLSQILHGETTALTYDQFLGLVSRLKIKGSEDIKQNTDGTFSAAKLTLAEIGCASLTIHKGHGGDKAEEVDPAGIKEFKVLLETLGINSKNFQTLLDKHGQKDKKKAKLI